MQFALSLLITARSEPQPHIVLAHDVPTELESLCSSTFTHGCDSTFLLLNTWANSGSDWRLAVNRFTVLPD